MAERERVHKTKAAGKQETKVEEVETVVDEEAAKLKAETDALLDEIDGLLEENAQEFVNSYVQKGGE
jgi:ubiquitin-like protein Pup